MQIKINNTLYRIGKNYYAEYFSKGSWRVSASVSNNMVIDKINQAP